MSKRETVILLMDMSEAINKVLVYTKDLTYLEFENDTKTQDAVYRNFEVIGEAANQINETFKLKYSKIDWRKIIGLRHRIIHAYSNVDNQIIWNITTNSLPIFLQEINQLISIEQKAKSNY